MRLFNNDPRIVERIYEGDDQTFTSLYEKYRDKFFAFFRARCEEEKIGNRSLYRFLDGAAYLDDLYQKSCLKLYGQIMTGKLFVDDGTIYLRSKDGGINKLTASLETYLTSIGRLTLKEMERGEIRYVDFDPIARIVHRDDNDPEYDISDNFRQAEASSVKVDPIFDLSFENDLNNEARFAIVREIVKDMGYPCKDIFTYSYFNEDGKRMKGEDIARKMGLASADVVKNQKSRCHKMFKTKYLQRMSELM